MKKCLATIMSLGVILTISAGNLLENGKWNPGLKVKTIQAGKVIKSTIHSPMVPLKAGKYNLSFRFKGEASALWIVFDYGTAKYTKWLQKRNFTKDKEGWNIFSTVVEVKKDFPKGIVIIEPFAAKVGIEIEISHPQLVLQQN